MAREQVKVSTERRAELERLKVQEETTIEDYQISSRRKCENVWVKRQYLEDFVGVLVFKDNTLNLILL